VLLPTYPPALQSPGAAHEIDDSDAMVPSNEMPGTDVAEPHAPCTSLTTKGRLVELEPTALQSPTPVHEIDEIVEAVPEGDSTTV
jgi:hypothetical protein